MAPNSGMPNRARFPRNDCLLELIDQKLIRKFSASWEMEIPRDIVVLRSYKFSLSFRYFF
jgi:hypothetical protein